MLWLRKKLLKWYEPTEAARARTQHLWRAMPRFARPLAAFLFVQLCVLVWWTAGGNPNRPSLAAALMIANGGALLLLYFVPMLARWAKMPVCITDRGIRLDDVCFRYQKINSCRIVPATAQTCAVLAIYFLSGKHIIIGIAEYVDFHHLHELLKSQGVTAVIEPSASEQVGEWCIN